MKVVLELLRSCTFLSLDSRHLPGANPSPAEIFGYNRPWFALCRYRVINKLATARALHRDNV